MSRQNIFSTLNVASIMPPSSIDELLKFLINNRQYLLSPAQRTELFHTRFTGHTAVSELVHRIVASHKEQAYSLLRIPPKTSALSEVVDMTFVPFDIKQMSEIVPSYSKSLSVIPELADKLVINITDLVKANGEFADVSQFQWRVVRDFLSRSYHVSGGNVWISPALVRYVAKVYSMTIGGQLARFFGLSDLIRTFVQALFALFYIGKMTSTALAQDFMKVNAKPLGHYDPQDLQQVFAFVEDTLGKKCPESLEDVFACIDAYSASQLSGKSGSRLDRTVLSVRFAAMFPESHVSTISLEYPPYLLFMILLVLSRHRSGLSIRIKDMNLLKEGHDVIDGLLRQPVFLSGL